MEIKIATCQCKDDFGRQRYFHYYLTVDQVTADGFFCENYGVRIAEENGNSSTIPSITTSATRIDALITQLVDHQVGPIGLSDVVADWL